MSRIDFVYQRDDSVAQCFKHWGKWEGKRLNWFYLEEVVCRRAVLVYNNKTRDFPQYRQQTQLGPLAGRPNCSHVTGFGYDDEPGIPGHTWTMEVLPWLPCLNQVGYNLRAHHSKKGPAISVIFVDASNLKWVRPNWLKTSLSFGLQRMKSVHLFIYAIY